MPDLHLIGVHEDGKQLLLADRAGAQFRLPIDDALRSVLRREYVDHTSPAEPMRPIEVQAMIRAGASAAEAAQRAGWPVEKVHRYEGPILAEREHIAQLAGRAHVPAAGALHPVSLRDRVDERLEQRGVAADDVDWDSWRSEDGQWTVEVTFAAGGRRRTAAWHFSRSSMTVSAIDDESRWLSGEDHSGSGAASLTGGSSGGSERRDDRGGYGTRDTGARDDSGRGQDYGRGGPHRSGVDAAGSADGRQFGAPGSRASDSSRGRPSPEDSGVAFGAPQRGTPHDPDSELTAGLRERAAARGRRRPRRLATSPGAGEPTLPGAVRSRPSAAPAAAAPVQDSPPASSARGASSAAAAAAPDESVAKGPAPTDIPDTGVAPDPDAVPLAPFDYDPATDGLPPGAHSDPDPDGIDGRPAAGAQSAGSDKTGAADPEPAAIGDDLSAPAPHDEQAPPAPSRSTSAPRRPSPDPSRSVASEGVEEPELPLHHGESSAEDPIVEESNVADSSAAAPPAREQAPSDTAAGEATDPSSSTPQTPEPSPAQTAPASAPEAKAPARSTRKRTASTRAPRRPAATPSGRAAKATSPRPPATGSDGASSSDTSPSSAPTPTPTGGPQSTAPAAAAQAQGAAQRPSTDGDAAPAQEASPPPARKTPARRNRASVPAWDDIMFGAKPPSS